MALVPHARSSSGLPRLVVTNETRRVTLSGVHVIGRWKGYVVYVARRSMENLEVKGHQGRDDMFGLQEREHPVSELQEDRFPDT
jgi:hypothetical protein